MKKTICVFCGSASGRARTFHLSAFSFGRLIAQKQYRLVYGGGNIGIMKALADGVLSAGGEVCGVIPEFMVDKELLNSEIQEAIRTKNMHERKMIMYEKADAFVVLPGGFGTLDEFFEVLTWKQLNIHNKFIGILNINNYFNKLLELLKHMEQEGFIRDTHLNMFFISPDAEELLEALENY